MFEWLKKSSKKKTAYGVFKDYSRNRHAQSRPMKVGGSPPAMNSGRREPKVPPVLVRGDTLGTPMVKKIKRSPRRRVHLPFQSKGVELSLPAFPTIQVGWRAFSSAIAGIMAVLLFIVWASPEYKVQAAQFYGLKRIDAQEINSILDIEGKSIFELDRYQIKKIIEEKYPEFMDVSVEVWLPSEVIVSVKEREAALLWMQDERTTFVDKEGIGFPARKKGSGLLVIYADEPPFLAFDSHAQPGQFLPPEAVQSILQLAKVVPEGVPLRFDKMHGLGWEDPQGWQVYFGSDFANIEQKMLVYQAIVDHVQGNGIVPTIISVEYLDAPYYHVE